MKLSTLNNWLRKIGLVLVVEIPTVTGNPPRLDSKPIRIWLERYSTFQRRRPQ